MNQMNVQPQWFNPVTIVDEVTGLLGDRARAKHLPQVRIGPRLRERVIDLCAQRKVLTNLVGNAIKFTSAGEITVSAVENGDTIKIAVKDTGEGIATDAQAYIFDEFRQADGSSRRRHGGTGLGLSIARRLVWMNGGKIWVESEPGIGSLFHFTVPTKPRRAQLPPSDAARTPAAPTTAG